MGKKTQHKAERKTAEFILTSRPMDDPDFNNPNVPQNVLLYVPKDRDDENTQKTLDNIPESIRGNTYDEETQAKLMKQKLGIDDINSQDISQISEKNEKEFNNKNKKNNKSDKNKLKVSQKVPNLVDELGNHIELDEDEELIDTNFSTQAKAESKNKQNENNMNSSNIPNNVSNYNKKNTQKAETIGFKSEKSTKEKEMEKLSLKDLLSGDKEKLLDIDDKTLDMIIKKSKAKINAEIQEYNEYGLKKNINPEVLEYVTDKKFREGIDLFIPAPNYEQVMQQNRVDIDINPDEMNEDYKEVYEALNKEESGDEGGLEDDFILLANDGKLPIEILENENMQDEIVLLEVNKKTANTPSYKFISKEEKEMLDRQFNKTYNKFYNEKDAGEDKDMPEEEFEEYEFDENEGSAAQALHKENKKSEKTVKAATKNLQSKEFNDAINELLPKHKRIEAKKHTQKKQSIGDIDSEQSEEGENSDEEDLEEEDEEEFEDFDENLLNDDYINKLNDEEAHEQESNLKYNDKLILTSKTKQGNKASRKNEILNKKNLIIKSKKQAEAEETVEDLENYLNSKEVLEMDMKVISNMILRETLTEELTKGKNNEDNDPAYELNYPKKYLDITSVGGTHGNMPKVVQIEGDPKKLEKKLRKEEKLKKEKLEKAQIKKNDNNKDTNNKNLESEKNTAAKAKIIITDNEPFAPDNKNNSYKLKELEKKIKQDFLEFPSDEEDNKNDLDLDYTDEQNFNSNINAENNNKLGEKQENKLRKKMLKNEKREKRKLKKGIKEAFKVN